MILILWASLFDLKRVLGLVLSQISRLK